MKYHFIGIGGVMMSGLAQLMFDMGHDISGCDLKKFPNKSKIINSKSHTNNLQPATYNLKIYEGHNQDHITKDLDGVIVTVAALHESSPAKEEIEYAKKMGIPIIRLRQMINKLMSKPGIIGITVSGMHGKTTTTTMIALILERAGFDPTALIGSDVKEWGTNYRYGKGKYFVAEACENRRQMLDLNPKIAVITNLEEEHLDTYPGGMKDIKQAFKKFIKKLPKNGLLIVWREDKNLMQLAAVAKKRGNTVREVSLKKLWSGLNLKVPGKHNLLDATFAARVAHEIGVSQKIIKETLNSFTGAARRFEIKGEKNGVTAVDDYGHHPTEIKATIEAAREYIRTNFKFETRSTKQILNSNKQNSKLIMVFQPHQYTRTKLLFKDFVSTFDGVDKLIITDIYLIAGREPAEARADFSRELVNEIKKRGIDVMYIHGYDNITKELRKISKPGDLIITQGATDIYKVGEEYLGKK
jgi:UDP-N-acetylmuramate--alanine ligase